MKIPTSSSVLLATLAVSSSSSCLAAPTGAGPQDNGMSSSPSFSSSPSSAIYHTGMNAHERPDTIVQRTAGPPVQVPSLSTVVQGIPVVGPILGGIIGTLLGPVHSLDVNGPDKQQINDLQNAAAELSRMLNTTTSTTAPANPSSGVASNDDGSGSSSANPSGASSPASAPGPSAYAASDGSAGAYPSSSADSSSASAAADPSSSAAGSSASAMPPSPSPTSPVVPPNTPVN